jgi:type I restriction enzyme M protein
MDAVRVVETAYKLVKKGDEELEVADGLKGRILPFELVQHEMFQKELDAIENLQERVDNIVSDIEELRDELLVMEDTDKYFDSEKDNALLKKEITADSKSKKNDIEPIIMTKLKGLVSKWTEQINLNKEIKIAKVKLEDKTVEAIKNLTDEQVTFFLHKKWIAPICNGLSKNLFETLAALEKTVLKIMAKYQTPCNEIELSLSNVHKELNELVEELTGDKFMVEGLKGLINR